MPHLTLAEVEAIAREAHAGQTDKAGRPYAEHIAAVAEGVRARGGSEEQIAAAWLHDAVEDDVLSPEWLDGRRAAAVRQGHGRTRSPSGQGEDWRRTRGASSPPRAPSSSRRPTSRTTRTRPASPSSTGRPGPASPRSTRRCAACSACGRAGQRVTSGLSAGAPAPVTSRRNAHASPAPSRTGAPAHRRRAQQGHGAAAATSVTTISPAGCASQGCRSNQSEIVGGLDQEAVQQIAADGARAQHREPGPAARHPGEEGGASAPAAQPKSAEGHDGRPIHQGAPSSCALSGW